MTLADWVLARLRAAMPNEAIYDGAMGPKSFDGGPGGSSLQQFVIVHCPELAHDSVGLSAASDVVGGTVTVHSFGTSRNERSWRQKRVVGALLDQVPVVDGFMFEPITHPVSRNGNDDYSIPDRIVLYGIDQFDIKGSTT